MALDTMPPLHLTGGAGGSSGAATALNTAAGAGGMFDGSGWTVNTGGGSSSGGASGGMSSGANPGNLGSSAAAVMAATAPGGIPWVYVIGAVAIAMLIWNRR